MNSLQMVFLGLCFLSLSGGLISLLDEDWSSLGGILLVVISFGFGIFGVVQVWNGLGQIAI